MLCVIIQQLILPLIYIMIIVYQVNYLLFDDVTGINNRLISLAVVGVPLILIFGARFSEYITKFSLLNAASLSAFIAFLVFIGVTYVYRTITEVNFESRVM